MMRTPPSIFRFLLLVLAIRPTFFFAVPASAQSTTAPARRQGVHFSIGGGASSTAATCDSCRAGELNDRVTGVSGMLQLGGFVTPHVAIAAEVSGWVKSDAKLDRRTTSAGLALLAYPSLSSGFFLKGAIGGMRARFELDGAVLQSDVATSQLGVGYDIPLGGVSLTPYVNATWTFGGRSQVSGVTIPETIHPNALQVGMAFTVP